MRISDATRADFIPWISILYDTWDIELVRFANSPTSRCNGDGTRDCKTPRLGGNHLLGVYNQGNNHQRPSYKCHKFDLGHPMSKMQQHAILSIRPSRIYIWSGQGETGLQKTLKQNNSFVYRKSHIIVLQSSNTIRLFHPARKTFYRVTRDASPLIQVNNWFHITQCSTKAKQIKQTEGWICHRITGHFPMFSK